MYNEDIKQNLQLTELFRPLRDSLNHLRKSDEGGGASSILGLDATTLLATVTAGDGLAGDAAERLGVEIAGEVGMLPFDAVGVIIGRAMVAATAGGAVAFPLEPTVVHTPPDCEEGTV